jgi:uncharacterized protein (DUF2062 family)
MGRIANLLRQGITPEKIALTIALGCFIGVIPMLGTTTILCTLAALAFRLNIPAIQMVNGVVYPLQLILLIPFYRMGAWLFGEDVSTISLSGVKALIQAGVLHAIQALWTVSMHALLAWAIVGAVTSAIIYVVALPLTRRIPVGRSATSSLQSQTANAEQS